MMRQYRRIKRELADDVILFFRLGDFYEMFFEDAREAAPVLDIALTKRNNVPMCGVPYHASESYMAKLIRAGRKVAVCDQVEDPSASRGIVRREVTRIVTAGTVTEEAMLESSRSNYLAGVRREGDTLGLALLDLAAGIFRGARFSDPGKLRDNLAAFRPSECAVAEDQKEDEVLRAVLDSFPGIQFTACQTWAFEYETARDALLRHFRVKTLDGFGCEGETALVGAAGGVMGYVKDDLRRRVEHVRSFQVYGPEDFLVLDEATCRNLDLVSSGLSTGEPGLNTVLDVTKTAMGGRLLREWILRPLIDRKEISARHDTVEAFSNDRTLLGRLRDALGSIRDLQRLIARIGTGSGNARDVAALGRSLAAVPEIRGVLEGHPSGHISARAGRMEPLPDLVDLIDRAIAESPPPTIREGGIIRKGYNAELDALRQTASDGRRWLAEYQEHERQRTGIGNLKVRHNKVFGYYIEVSRGRLSNVPPDYIRKQTLVNAERFSTEELKEYESRILGAQDKATALEHEIFLDLRQKAAANMECIQATAAALAELDVLGSFADRATALNYTRPVITEKDIIRIRGGRHPLVEQMADTERFVPNDTLLDCSRNQIVIITGPNMAGKSTYIRQVALISVMAQAGSFVPADEAETGIVDRVFTRIGATDELTRGRSTFMVEMQETANILNNATAGSLIVLDEIGRGTSTFDGISIAWAVAEYLHNSERAKAKTLFATHYHELTDLALTLDGVKNYNVQVREKNDTIVFLRKIVPGGSDKSYGIHVSRLAGMPHEVTERAGEILANLSEGEFAESGQPKIARRKKKGTGNPGQLNLFPEK
ncbi:MAG: DNA mismatch repair protein MutS [Kiritimatiellia bacterium]